MGYINEIIQHVKRAQVIASAHGLSNLLQPGLVKELVIAEILDHEIHKTKHEPDAWDKKDPSLKFEYLSCFQGGTFQFDRMFKAPADKRKKSLDRIARNSKIFCAIFKEDSPLDVEAIYEVNVKTVLKETERQLDRSSNDISHVGYTIKWVKENGTLIYSHSST